MNSFIANSDYEEKNTRPIRLAAGDSITLGDADRTWPGWIWAQDSHGHAGYIPAHIISTDEQGLSTVSEPFDPTVLTIVRGDSLTSLRQIDGWHWCKNQAGAEGWVAGYLLRPHLPSNPS